MIGLRRFCLLGVLVFCVYAKGQSILIPASSDAVKGAPFTLTVEMRREMVSGAGPIEVTQRILRDSAGRQRYEARVLDGVPASSVVGIYDVVAGKYIKLDTDAKTAEVRLMTVGRSESIDVRTVTSVAPKTAEADQTLLGTKVIAGLEAWGQRTVEVSTGSDGSTVDRDREVWVSTHYRMPVMQILRSAQGKVTQSVVRFDAAEPDPALFQIPAGFAVKDGPPMAAGVFRVGGSVSAPVLLRSVDPKFSDEARRQKVSGTVIVALVVNEQGLPEEVRVVRSVGHGLDEKAVEAVRQYRFKPAMRNGVPVRMQVNVSVNFRIF